MLAILRIEPDIDLPENAAITPGTVNSPVCLLQSGAGTEPKTTAVETASTTLIVSPCRYPWDVPLGVITSVGTGTVTIQTSGEIQLNRGYATSSPFFGTPTIGERVYFDGVNGQYVCAHSHGAQTDTIGLFPGAAAIGYVSGVTDTSVRIRIEPQPPTAEYIAVQISNTLVRGDVVMIDADTGVAEKWIPGQRYCDGVYTGYVFRKTTSAPYIGLICVSGPTWIHPTYAQLYAINSATSLANYSPHSARVGADYSIHITSSDGSTKNVPTAGFLRWEKWYYDTTSTGKLTVLLDVAPNPISTGILDPEEDKGLEDFPYIDTASIAAKVGMPVVLHMGTGFKPYQGDRSSGLPTIRMFTSDSSDPFSTTGMAIGIMRSYNATAKTATVQTRGTLGVNISSVYGKPFKGARVSAATSIKHGSTNHKLWIINNASNLQLYDPSSTTPDVVYNLTPGGATVGFVQDYTDSTVTIRLDFRPALATYRRMVVSGDVEYGTVGGIDVENSSVVKQWDRTMDVVGICASTEASGTSDHLSFCTHGPAWLRVKYKDLFAIDSYSTLATKYGTGSANYNLPIAANGAIAFRNPDRLPIIGNAAIDAWDALVEDPADIDDDDYVLILVDVDIIQGVKVPAGITIKYDSGTVANEDTDVDDSEDGNVCSP